MIIRWAQLEDLNEVREWWPKQGIEAPPVKALSGLAVAQTDGRLLAAMSLYLERAGFVAFIAYVAANPDAGIKERNVALSTLLLSLEGHARKMGYGIIECFTGTPAIAKRLERSSYKVGDKQVTHYLKGL